jgi:predicted nucleic acid-binding protein
MGLLMAGERLYFDTNIFIRMYEGRADDEIAPLLLAVLAASGKGAEPRVVTSELTLAELLVKPLAKANTALIARYENLISSNSLLQVLAVDRTVLRTAAELRAIRSALRLPDAIHVSTARTASCDIFMTTDTGIHSIEGLSVLHAEPAALEKLLAGRP